MSIKIDSPFAHFDGNLLTCKLCNSQVKSAKVWTAHVNGKQHIKKLLELKSKKATTEAVKRPSSNVADNSNVKRTKLNEQSAVNGSYREERSSTKVPGDFFDGGVPIGVDSKKVDKNIPRTANHSDVQTPSTSRDTVDKIGSTEASASASVSAIPEGFFDDKKSDAKARNVELKDPLDDEWQRFQKEIKQAQTVIDAIVEEDDERLNVERTLDEIDEEIRGWAKVNELEKKVEKTVIPRKLPELKKPKIEEDFDEDAVDNVTLEEMIDWRSKQLWK